MRNMMRWLPLPRLSILRNGELLPRSCQSEGWLRGAKEKNVLACLGEWGGHKLQFGIDEYVFAALNLYLDIINLFLHILSLFCEQR